MQKVDLDKWRSHANSFCEAFLRERHRPRLIFGINEYADSIAKAIDIDGFIDDFTSAKEHLNKPVYKTGDAPRDALVVSIVIGRPFTAERRLIEAGLVHIDYFAFATLSGLDILPVKFWKDFSGDYAMNRNKYETIRKLLSDNTSVDTYDRLIKFRLTGCLDYMRGFTDTQYRQYFEEFLNLQRDGESFVDVGGFDGYTSAEFIKRCPNYSAVHLFEPETSNLDNAKRKLSHFRSIVCHELGMSSFNGTLRFTPGGSTSAISDAGECVIKVARLDDVITEPVSFIKMDIEGAESAALEGAKNTIIRNHPKLAICVYHKFHDFWSIPEQVLSYRSDYTLYLRHYTEGVDETVMFFVPQHQNTRQ